MGKHVFVNSSKVTQDVGNKKEDTNKVKWDEGFIVKRLFNNHIHDADDVIFNVEEED